MGRGRFRVEFAEQGPDREWSRWIPLGWGSYGKKQAVEYAEKLRGVGLEVRVTLLDRRVWP